MVAPLVMAAVRVGAMTAIAYKGIEDMKQLGKTADEYLVNNKTPIEPGVGHNDARDAFRHAFASAKVTQSYGETTANVLGSLHEYQGNFKSQPEKECGMDMWNNKVGREIGKGLPPGASDAQIATAVISAIQKGDLITNVEDPRTKQGYKELLTPDQLGERAVALVKEAKAMVAQVTPDVIKTALSDKNLSGPVVEGLAGGLASLEKNFSPSFNATFNRSMEERAPAR